MLVCANLGKRIFRPNCAKYAHSYYGALLGNHALGVQGTDDLDLRMTLNGDIQGFWFAQIWESAFLGQTVQNTPIVTMGALLGNHTLGVHRTDDLDLSRSSGEVGPDRHFSQRQCWKTVPDRPVVIMGHYWETIYWECNGPIKFAHR